MVSSLLPSLRVLLLLLPLLSYGLKFELQAESRPQERCIRNFVNKDTLVVVTANIDGNRGDGQRVDMHVREDYEEPHKHKGTERRERVLIHTRRSKMQ